MMTGIISRSWQTVKPHIPLIKFRKGGTTRGHAPSEASGAAPGDAGKGKGHTMQTVSRPVIEDWQLPPRYRRQMLDEKEIALINSGGAY